MPGPALFEDVQLVDDTFIGAPSVAVAAAVHDREAWARWWPGVQLEITVDRGDSGLTWAAAGLVRGELEVWLEPAAGGVILHWYVRGAALPPARPSGGARLTRGRRPGAAAALTRRWKDDVHALKDALEGRRRGGDGS